MTEIKKITKISIAAYAIVCLIFAIMLMFFLDAWIAVVNMPTWVNEFHPRGFAGALLVVVLFGILVFVNKNWDWEKIKVAYIVLYAWLPINITIEATLIVITPISNELLSQGVMDLIIESILLVLGIYSYIKQER
jgi:hypothetical protein